MRDDLDSALDDCWPAERSAIAVAAAQMRDVHVTGGNRRLAHVYACIAAAAADANDREAAALRAAEDSYAGGTVTLGED